MKPQTPIYGLMVEFLSPQTLLDGTVRAWQAGYRRMDAYSPYPVAGLAAALGLRRTRIPAVVLMTAVIGACAGFTMQYYAMAVDYPWNVGGRPLNSWPFFVPITFEVLVLVASLGAFLSMLFLNGLPRPHHPVFHVPQFARASQDRFFLCIEADDGLFDLRATTEFLVTLHPHGLVIEVPHDLLLEPKGEKKPAEGMREPASTT